MAKVRVATLGELPSGAKLVAEIQGTPILIVNVHGQFYALHNICSHAEASLSEGDVDADELCVECPLHGAIFDLRSGRPRTLPAFEPVATYTVWAEGDVLFVEYPA
jgi:3-phenylpropionate/trans-cinnamate dioxygenase ferredoxin subunit